MMLRNKVLILINHYIPGYKYGGPIRSIQAIKSKLKKYIDFKIFTTDRDFGDKVPFESIEANTWNNEKKNDTYYFNGNLLKYFSFIIKESKKYNFIYLNSFFNPLFSMSIVILKYMGLIRNQIILAPRGEFNLGALDIKSGKKRFFITIVKTINLYKGVRWHATTEEELMSIHSIFGNDVEVYLAEGMSPKEVNRSLSINSKVKGKLNLVFLARISKIKNLDFLLKTLLIVDDSKEINLTVYGPIENLEYWKESQLLINEIHRTKPLIKVLYEGEVDYIYVDSIISKFDFYILPTLGENFGQSIADAFSVGLPVITSNKTPWTNLKNEGVGWDLPLNSLVFKDVLEECVNMSNEQYFEMQNNCLNYAEKFLNNEVLLNKYLKLFKE